MKGKKESASRKNWKINATTDSLFNFAISNVLKEATKNKEHMSYEFDERVNFVKISFDLTLEALARLQVPKFSDKLDTGIKLALENLKKINDASRSLIEVTPYTMTSSRCTDYINTEELIHNNKTVYMKDAVFIETLKNPYNFAEYSKDIKNDMNAISVLSLRNRFMDGLVVDELYDEYCFPVINIYRFHKKNFKIVKKPNNDINVYCPAEILDLWDTSKTHSDEAKQNLKFDSFMEDHEITGHGISPDVLLAFPYNPFNALSNIIYNAIDSGFAEELFFTGYRLGKDNPLINAIIKATKNGIKCNVYIELLARGEYRNNLECIKKLIVESELSNLTLFTNYNDIKVHSKIIHIKLNTGRAVSIIGTGNFNPQTAKLYKDYHYVTSNPDSNKYVEAMVSTLFTRSQHSLNSISGVIIKEINKQIALGKKGRIYMQTNHLDNEVIIKYLKEAIRRGVDVKLIVRTTKGFKKKDLNAKTVTGRYLEHARVYIFGKGSDETVYLSSSDLLFRNLYNRFEAYISVTDFMIKRKLIKDFLQLYKNGQK